MKKFFILFLSIFLICSCSNLVDNDNSACLEVTLPHSVNNIRAAYAKSDVISY